MRPRSKNQVRGVTRLILSLLVCSTLVLVSCQKHKKIPPDHGNGLPDICVEKHDEIFSSAVTVTIDVDPLKAKVPFRATLKATATPTEYTEIVKYQWDLNGDQVYDLETEQDEIEYEFIAPQRVTVSVQAFDNCGLSGNIQANIDAQQNQPPEILAFYADHQQGPSPLNTLLVVRARDPDGVLVRCDWDLNTDGDFEQSAGADPPAKIYDFALAHSFTRAGWYRVRARVMDDNGAITYSNEIIVKVSLSIRRIFARDYGSGQAESLALDMNEAGNLADIYTAMGSSGIAIFTIPDLSQPGQLTLIGRAEASGYARKIRKYGDVVYLANEDVGLMIYFIPSPYYVSYEGQLVFCQISDVEVAEYGGRVYVFAACAYPAMLEIYDVTSWYDDLYPSEAGLFSINYTPELGGGQGTEAVSVKWDPRGFIYLGLKNRGAVVYDFRNPSWGEPVPILGIAPTLALYYLNRPDPYNPVSLDFADHPRSGKRYLYLGGTCDSGWDYRKNEVVTYDISDLSSATGSLFVFGEDLHPRSFPSSGTATAHLLNPAVPYYGNDIIPANLYKNGFMIPDGEYEFHGAQDIIIHGYDQLAVYKFDYVRNWISRFNDFKDDDQGPYLKSITVKDDILYAAMGGYGMQIVDYSDPIHPRMAISDRDERFDPNTKGNDSVNQIGVYGDYSLIADGYLGVTAARNHIAGTGPYSATPELIRSYNTSGSPKDIFLRRPELLVALGKGGVDIMDVSFSPQNPVILANVDTPGESYGVWESPGRDYIYVADRNIKEADPDPADEDALWVVDRNHPSPDTPSLLNKWPADPGTISNISAVWGTEGRLYLMAERLYILDTLDPTAPVFAGTIDIYPKQLVVKGNLIYSLNLFGLQVLDCRYPQAVTLIGEYHSPDSALVLRGFDIQGDYAYVSDGVNLRVLDLTFPGAITEVTRIAITGDNDRIFSTVKAFENFAVLGAGIESLKAGLAIVDISNPRSLNMLGLEPDYIIAKLEAFKDENSGYYYIYTLDGEVQFSVFQVSGLD